jgi:hypothetical protein
VASGVGSSDPGSFGSFGPPDPGLVVEVAEVGSVVVGGWIVVVVVDIAAAIDCSAPQLLSLPKAPKASTRTTSRCQRLCMYSLRSIRPYQLTILTEPSPLRPTHPHPRPEICASRVHVAMVASSVSTFDHSARLGGRGPVSDSSVTG